ncbi:MAG: hypothetical protein DLM69_07695 [Candidatus Chloroheliales bacterium]|nr:MAG: hypothetical protein DLM69_07695 [Chloroflexota bacterium]
MQALYTIGFTKKPLRKFLTLLRDAGVDAVIDVRRHNSSQLAGYAKKDDLACILELAGIGYQHALIFAPDEDLLAQYKSKAISWDEYERQFQQGLEQANPIAEATALLAPYQRPALLCAEDEAKKCHRRLVAEWLASKLGNVEIVHLR